MLNPRSLLLAVLLVLASLSAARADNQTLPEGRWVTTDGRGEATVLVAPQNQMLWRLKLPNQALVVADGHYKVTAFNVEAGLQHVTYRVETLQRGKQPLAETKILGTTLKPGAGVDFTVPVARAEMMVVDIRGARYTLKRVP